MTTKYPTSIEFTDSGHFMRIIHKSGFVIAEFIVNDVNLMNRAAAGYDRLGKLELNARYRIPGAFYKGEITEICESSIIQEEIENLNDMLEEHKRYQAYVEETLFKDETRILEKTK